MSGLEFAFAGISLPKTKTGRKVMASMKKTYGKEKGESVFHASINKGITGSAKWHEKVGHRKKQRKDR